MSILDEFARSVERGAIVLRGEVVPARMLSGREQLALRAAFPQPTPPMAQAPGKGGLSKAPNHDDPGYRAEKERRDFELMAAELAIACELHPGWAAAWDDGQADAHVIARWLREAAGRVLEVLGLVEVNDAFAELRSLGDGLAVRAYAQLVGEDPKSLPADQVQVLRIDPSKPPSELAIVLRVHARFGRDPASDWWAGLPEPHKAVLIAFEHAEEVREGATR